MKYDEIEGEDIGNRIKFVGAAIITVIMIETVILVFTNWIDFCL
jgi:hypothetical protein